MIKNQSFYHVAAIAIVAIWGVTFISTKLLLTAGLTPASIMFYRFAIAYVCMLIFARERVFANNFRDELLLMMAGLCGGTLYFVTENQALQITYASSVSLILSTAPLLTMFLNRLFFKETKISNALIGGSFVALAGVAMVIYNGDNAINLGIVGGFLSLAAALSWAVYTIFIKKLENRYSMKFITRKVFFYGLIGLIPMFFVNPLNCDTEILFSPMVLMNMIFLGIIASFGCFLGWNIVLKHLGAVKTSNYIYFSPVITLIAAFIILDERISIIAIIGSLLIIFGVYAAEKFHR